VYAYVVARGASHNRGGGSGTRSSGVPHVGDEQAGEARDGHELGVIVAGIEVGHHPRERELKDSVLIIRRVEIATQVSRD
jgi:hypothetical protein